MNTTRLPILVNDLSHWLRNQIVAEVPTDLAVCEFECRKTKCFPDQWVCCERRLSRETGEHVPLASQRDGSGKSSETEGEFAGTKLASSVPGKFECESGGAA